MPVSGENGAVSAESLCNCPPLSNAPTGENNGRVLRKSWGFGTILLKSRTLCDEKFTVM